MSGIGTDPDEGGCEKVNNARLLGKCGRAHNQLKLIIFVADGCLYQQKYQQADKQY